MTNLSPICACLVVITAIPQAARAADEAAIIEKIKADWMGRYEAYDSFVYRSEGSLIVPKHSMHIWLKEPTPEEELLSGNHPFPPEDRALPYEIVWYVDLASSRFRNETLVNVFEREKLDWRRRRAIEAFDGETLWSGSSELDDQVILQPNERTKWFFSYSDKPPFFAHGLFPLTTFSYGKLSKQTAKTLAFEYQGEGVVHGRACHIVDIARQPGKRDEHHRVYVDHARDSAILRYDVHTLVDIYEPGSSFTKSTRRLVPTIRTTIAYQEQEGFWAPKSWRSEMLDAINTRIAANGDLESSLAEATALSDIEVELGNGISDDLFEQPLESGTIVRDRRGGEGGTFQVAEDGETLVPVSRVPGAGSGGWNFMITAFAVLGITLIVVAIILRARVAR